MMHKIRAFLIEPLPVDNALVKQSLEIAFGDIEVLSAQSFSDVQGDPDIIVASVPAAAAIESLQTDHNHLQPAPSLVGLGTGDLQYGEAIGENEWTPASLPRAFRAAMRMHKLRSENRQLRGDLLTTARRLSHDLRSPLGCIHTNGDMIKELGLAALDEATLRESAGLILDSAKEATALVNRIAQVLRASAEPPQVTSVDSGLALKEALNSFRSLAPMISTPDTSPRVMAVQSWLTIIWINLIENAVLHGGKGSKIHVDWRKNSGCIHFSVTDNGPGIPGHQIPTLFRPFEQLHANQSGGLGLSIVHRLVTRMGGTCGHLKPPEGGACFTFTLAGVPDF